MNQFASMDRCVLRVGVVSALVALAASATAQEIGGGSKGWTPCSIRFGCPRKRVNFKVLGRPFVLLSADKDNGSLSRFDLAHELGHLILHRYIPRPTERDRHKQLEQQAHRFAGAFLLPAETLATEVRMPVTLDDYLLLKDVGEFQWALS